MQIAQRSADQDVGLLKKNHQALHGRDGDPGPAIASPSQLRPRSALIDLFSASAHLLETPVKRARLGRWEGSGAASDGFRARAAGRWGAGVGPVFVAPCPSLFALQAAQAVGPRSKGASRGMGPAPDLQRIHRDATSCVGDVPASRRPRRLGKRCPAIYPGRRSSPAANKLSGDGRTTDGSVLWLLHASRAPSPSTKADIIVVDRRPAARAARKRG